MLCQRLRRAGWALALFALAPATMSAGQIKTPATPGFHEPFLIVAGPGWNIANYEFSHPSFDTDWSRDRLQWNEGLEISLRPKALGDNRFEGGSIRRTTQTHYGRYEATLQPAKGVGVVTGFFTYTGPYYGTRHDEIDIEFLGKDTTKMHVAWFVDGKLHNRFVALGFDAAEAPRRYGFEWLPGSIRWFVEDRELFSVTAPASALPQAPGFVFLNIWAADPSIASWSGTPAADTTARALVRDVRFTPARVQSAAMRPAPPG